MKSTHRCPKCGHHRVLKVLDVADRSADGTDYVRKTVETAALARLETQVKGLLTTSNEVRAEGELEAWSCPRCGYSELYVKDPGSITVDGCYVIQHEGEEARTLRARVESLELTLASMIELLKVRVGVSSEELGLMMQRLDLADGVEDGRIGPNVTHVAPRCAACGRPVNPARNVCIFCNAPIVRAAERANAGAVASAPRRTVTCSVCGAVVAESDSYFSDRGLVCAGCFAG